MAEKKFFLGPSLLGEIRETISVVSAMPRKDGSTSPADSPTQQSPEGQIFRVGTATGSWNKAATNTVTWNPAGTLTSATIATNLFADISGSTATYSCAIARVGSTWYLVAAECT